MTRQYLTTDRASRNIAIIAMYMENHTLAEVGLRFFLTGARVRKILQENGISPRKSTPSPKNTLKYRPTRMERFWRQVNKNQPKHARLGTPCWLWTGCHGNQSGYGAFTYYSGRQLYTHQVSWLHTHRRMRLLKNEWILHKCDRPSCVNPDHLYKGTPQMNAMDRDARRRHMYQYDKREFCRRLREGQQRSGKGPLFQTADILYIRQEAQSRGYADIGKEMNTSSHTIKRVVLRLGAYVDN